MFFEYATNAACPQRPSWQIAEVGYDWAQIVFRSRKSVRKVKRRLQPERIEMMLTKGDRHDESVLEEQYK